MVENKILYVVAFIAIIVYFLFSQKSVTQEPVTQPPVTQPPIVWGTWAPITQPPVTQPPVTQPPVIQIPVIQIPVIKTCYNLPIPENIPRDSVFQVGNKCYSCHPNIPNINSTEGNECLRLACDEGWSKDFLSNVCFKCPVGYVRDYMVGLDSVYACKKEGASIWSIDKKPVEKQLPTKTWTYIGSLENYEWLGIL